MNNLTINNKSYDLLSPTDIEFRNQYIRSFGDQPQKNVSITWNHISGFKLFLSTETDDEFDIDIYDSENNHLFSTKLKNTMFTTLSRKYYNGIRYTVSLNGELIGEETISFKNKRVYISFDSSSLGDTISWVSYCEEFRRLHDCEVIVSTFHNFLFEKTYDNLTFVKPGDVVHNINAMFNLGWFYDNNKEPQNPQSIPLQKAATNILGLPFKEIHTEVYIEPKEPIFKEKYVCIATNSTAGCKEWSNPNGWTELTDYLLDLGYRVINISKDGTKIPRVTKLKDDSLENTMSVIYNSEFVIGLSSGLSWLSWGLGKHVVMISNFTEPDHEFTKNCTRIINTSVCNGCWNNPMFKFDKGDWNWCPEHKGTERQFECHKSITSEMVINQIKHLIK
jgi:autotransporter strand-loop-strand O-heptosyltransferase